MQNSMPIYYTGYEVDDEESSDEDNNLQNEKSESSSDEIERDFQTFLQSKTKPKKKELKQADDFEDEMDKQLEFLINQQKDKYLNNNQKEIEMSTEESTKPSKKEEEKRITYEEEEDTDSEEEFKTGLRCTKKKQKFTDEELFYDPNRDDQDENWVNKQRETSKKVFSPTKKLKQQEQEPSTSENVIYIGANSDAILNCPCCMTNVCYDCQRHEKFKTQYRAMFVTNCKINEQEQLKYPKNEMDTKKFNKKKSKLTKVMESVADIEISSENDDLKYDLFKPVACLNCNTEIGVYEEKEEIYHFFNVLSSHS